MAELSSNLSSRPFDPNDSYDIIFCGGGTSACVAAGRLAAADPSLQILLIERGKSNLGDAQISNPLLMLANMAPGSNAMMWYHAEPEENLNNKPRVLSTGGVLGGGSSVNAMMYSRAQKVDFESFGMDGWGWEECLRCAKKLETVHMYGGDVDESIHGSTGPVNISYSTHLPIGPVEDFLDAVKSFEGTVVENLQNFETGNAWGKGAKSVGIDGVRQDTASRYIHPLMADGKHPHLHVLTENLVSRVIFEGNRAVGVEFEPEPLFLQQDLGMTKRVARTIWASKLVVVSSGVLGTPLILERSGIGSEARLSDLGINVVSDLPGVGENYQDHHFVLPGYKADLGAKETLDDLLTGQYDVPAAIASSDPFLGWNAVDVWGKLRMTSAEAEALGPEFKKAWDRDYCDKPTKPIMMMGIINSLMADRRALPDSDQGGRFITMASYTAYPYSRGSIHIKSSDVLIAPHLVTGFLSDKDDIDLKKSVWAYKKGRDLYRRTNAFIKEVSIAHPKFKHASTASLAEAPLRSSKFTSVDDRKEVSPLEYDEDDDRAIEEFIRDNVMSTWHGLGTCKMGSQSKGGVVDESLNVHGCINLKCVDLSVIPENVGSNTANMAMIVGERAAEIISKELGY